MLGWGVVRNRRGPHLYLMWSPYDQYIGHTPHSVPPVAFCFPINLENAARVAEYCKYFGSHEADTGHHCHVNM